MMDKRHRAGRRIVAMLGAVCAAVFLLEGLARLTLDPAAAGVNDTLLRHSNFFQRDAQLGWLPRPRVEGTDPYDNRLIPFRTNSLGWRDKEYSLAPAASHSRIAVFGDGFTWGLHVQDNDVYTEILESLLPQTEVINLGVPGFAIGQEIDYFKRAALPYHPDTVLLAFSVDNIYTADGKLIQKDLDRTTQPVNTSPQETAAPSGNPILAMKQVLQERSAFYRWGRGQLTTNRTLVNLLSQAGLREPLGGVESLPPSLQPVLKQPPASITALMTLVETRLLELHRLLADQEIRLIIVLVPSKSSVDRHAFDEAVALTRLRDDEFDLDQPYRRLEEFAARHRIELVNPLSRFRAAHTTDNPLYLAHDKHFSAKGHAVFAQELYRYLTQEMPSPSTSLETQLAIHIPALDNTKDAASHLSPGHP